MRPIDPVHAIVNLPLRGQQSEVCLPELNLDPTTQPDASGDGPSTIRPTAVESSDRPTTTVVFDAPSIRAAMPRWLNDPSRPAGRIDLAALLRALDQQFGVTRACFVDGRQSGGREVRWRQQVRQAGWRWHEDEATGQAWPRRAGEGAIHRRLQLACSTCAVRPERFVLVSHDAAFAGGLQTLLSDGGRVVLVSFVERLARELYTLSDHPNASLLDLQYDLGVVGRNDDVDTRLITPATAPAQ